MIAAGAKRRRRLVHYLVLVLALVLVGGAYSIIASPSKAAAPTASQAAQGRQLYLRGCSSCHGLNAQGGDLAPSLIGIGAAAVDFQVSTGRMPLKEAGVQPKIKPPQYNGEETRALAQYIATLGPGPAIPSESEVNSAGADIGQGGALFRINCAQCHNFTGQGGALTNGEHAPALTNATPRQIYEAMITGPAAMPVFTDRVIPTNEKKEIIGYIKAVRTQSDPGGANLGRVGPVTEGLVAWIVGIGVIIAVAAWLGAKARRA